MKYCNQCQCEYEDYAEVCSDCGGPLLAKEEADTEVKHSDDQALMLVHLTNVDSDLEAERVLALLASEGIEAIKKFKGAGSYLNIVTGVNYQGVDLYVSETDIETAQMLIEPIGELPEAYADEMPLDAMDEEDAKHRGRSMKWMIRLGYLLPMSLMILYTVWKGLTNWWK